MTSQKDIYPKLHEKAKEEAQLLMDSFKPKIKEVISELMSDLYCNVSEYIESDHWHNYRNHLLDGLKNYNYAKNILDYDFVKIRKAILDENRDEIIHDLNKDSLDKIKSLEEEIEFYNKSRRF